MGQELGQAMAGTAFLCPTVHGASSGRTPIAEGDSNDWGQESLVGFLKHVTGAWAGMV